MTTRRLSPTIALWLATGVLLLAAAARLINAGGWSIWTDEGASLYLSSDPRLSAIVDKLTENHHPPLYFAALGRWRLIAGEARIALRLPTILSGVLAAAVIYRLGADWFSRSAGLSAALLFAVFDIAIHYSQQIRHYGWLVLAVALTTLLLLRWLRRPSWPLLLAYAVSVALMLYTHYLGVIMLAGQMIAGLVLWRGGWRDKLRLVGGWLIAFALYIPWLIALRQILQLLNEGGLATRPNIAPSTLTTLAEFVDLLGDGQGALIAALGLLALWRVARGRWWTTTWVARLFLIGMGGGLFVALFVVNTWIPLLTARTVVFLVPGIVLAAGWGFTLLPGGPRALLLAVLVSLSLATTRVIQPRLDSETVARTLAAGYSPGDVIVLETGSDDNALHYEIRRALADPDAEIIRTLRWVSTRGGVLPVVEQIDYELRQARRVWVVQWLQPSQVMPFLDAGGLDYRLADARELSVGDEYRDLFFDNTFTVALYTRPRDGAPLSFGDTLALHDAILAEAVRAGAALHVDLWWSALTPPPLDYSVGVFLLDEAGVTRAEHHAPPGSSPTSTWTPGALHFDRHTLHLPPDLPPGTYTVAVRAYWYATLEPLRAGDAALVTVGSVRVAPH